MQSGKGTRGMAIRGRLIYPVADIRTRPEPPCAGMCRRHGYLRPDSGYHHAKRISGHLSASPAPRRIARNTTLWRALPTATYRAPGDPMVNTVITLEIRPVPVYPAI